MTQMLELSCIVCKKPIPEKRAMQRSNTCEKACRSKLKAFYRFLSTLRKCRHCNKPSTPLERSQFSAWRRSQGVKPGRPTGSVTKVHHAKPSREVATVGA